MNKVINFDRVEVYGLFDSIQASTYPMKIDLKNTLINVETIKKLANATPGSGHDCFLKGIIVQMDITAPEYWWRQADRYTWFEYVSSQSKMHKLIEMNIDEACNKWVDMRIKAVLKEKICIYNQLKEKRANKDLLNIAFQEVVSNCPCGFMLTARKSTNYLQLKTMWNQRCKHPHKLAEWKEFDKWIHTLPFYWYITGEEMKEAAPNN